jgi:DNA end-binding protein Ku
MARPLWRGSLSFGLVNIPVALVPAVTDLDVHFHQLHGKTHARLEVRRVCTKEGKEVSYDEVGYGYELDDGKLVILTDEELAAVAPERTRTIDIEQFVDAGEIDPVLYDRPYYLIPDETGEGPARAYHLLVEAMRDQGRAAVGRFVLRTKEHLAAIRVRDGVLQITTMRFADEVRDPKELPLPDRRSHRPQPKEVENAVALIDALSADFDPDKQLRDRRRERLLKVIERKRKGETIKAPRAPEAPKAVPDLLEALERSLAEVRGETAAAR